MKEFVLFDLGNTLVRYYDLPDYPPILRVAVGEVASFLGAETDWARVAVEDFEAKDFQVRPLAGRLGRIFPDAAWSDETALEACRRFMKPIFALAHIYDDVLPILAALRERSIQTAIVSNTPWGSPAALWREEMARLALAEAVDTLVFCPDCGWRKPARPIFDLALQKLGATPGQCLFIGDDPRWDIVGPQALGIDAALIDRRTQTLPDVLKGMLQ